MVWIKLCIFQILQVALSMLRRFKEKGFAKGASREQISQCRELLNLELSEFLGLCLEGLNLVRGDLTI